MRKASLKTELVWEWGQWNRPGAGQTLLAGYCLYSTHCNPVSQWIRFIIEDNWGVFFLSKQGTWQYFLIFRVVETDVLKDILNVLKGFYVKNVWDVFLSDDIVVLSMLVNPGYLISCWYPQEAYAMRPAHLFHCLYHCALFSSHCNIACIGHWQRQSA